MSFSVDLWNSYDFCSSHFQLHLRGLKDFIYMLNERYNSEIQNALSLKKISELNYAVTTFDSLLDGIIGFKTDKRSDQGSDYFEISKREDYVSKATILENGHIIMPTLSDKKTYFYIDGITLPGLNPENLGDQFVIPKDGRTQLDEMLS